MSTKKEEKEEKNVAIVVVKRFRDKFDHMTYYEVGDEPEFDEDRAGDVVKRGLAEWKIDEG